MCYYWVSNTKPLCLSIILTITVVMQSFLSGFSGQCFTWNFSHHLKISWWTLELISCRYVTDVQSTILKNRLSRRHSNVLAAPDNLEVRLLFFPASFHIIILLRQSNSGFIFRRISIKPEGLAVFEPRLKIRLSLPQEVSSSKQELEGVCVETWGPHTSGVNSRQCMEAGRIQQSPLHWTSFSEKEAEFQKEENAAFSWTAWAEAIIRSGKHPFFWSHLFQQISSESVLCWKLS